MINNTNQIFLFFLLLLFTPSLFAQEVSTQPTAQQLLNPDWMEKQLKDVGIDQLVETYDGYQQKEIKLLHSALLLSQYVLREHPEALRSQLQGRLVSHSLPLLKPFQQLPKDQVQIYAITGGLIQAGGSTVRAMTENGNQLLFGEDLTQAILLKEKSQMMTILSSGLIKIWNIDQGKVLRSFHINQGSSGYRLSLSPDKKTLIAQGNEVASPGQPAQAGGLRYAIHVWDVATGKLRCSSTLLKGFFPRYIISPDSTKFFVKTGGQPLTCWDIKTGKKQYSFADIKDSRSIFSISFYPDGKSVLLAKRGKFSSYNLETGKHLVDILSDVSIGGRPAYTAITTDNQYALIIRYSGNHEAFYELLNLKTGKNRIYLKGYFPPWAIRFLKFSVDKKEIIARYAGSIKFRWDIETGKMLQSYPGLPANFKPISISHDGTRMLGGGWAGGGLGGVLKVCDLNNSATTPLLTGNDPRIFSILVSPDKKEIITAGADKQIKRWDFQTMKLKKSINGHSKIILAADISADGKKIVTSSFGDDAVVKIWDLKQGKLLKTFTGQNSDGINFSIAITPDGKEIVSGMGGSYMSVWNIETGKMRKASEELKKERRGSWNSKGVTKIVFSPDGKSIITGGRDNNIKVWDRNTLKLLSKVNLHQSPISYLVFSVDGKSLISGADDGRIRIDRYKDILANNSELQRTTAYQFHKSRICLLASLQGGKFILSGSKTGWPLIHSDSSLRIWNPVTNKLLTTFYLDSQIQSATFLSDGKYILIGTNEGEIHKFRIDNLPK